MARSLGSVDKSSRLIFARRDRIAKWFSSEGGTMRFLSLIAAAFTLFISTAVQARPNSTDYMNDDGGYLVYSVGTIAIGMDFSFPYHRVSLVDGSSVDDWKGVIEPKLGGMWVLRIKNPDFSGRETGHVIVRRLPPGSYAIDNFAFFGQLPGVASYQWSSGKPFKISFVIAKGQATYIGSFMRAPSLGTSLQPQLGAAGFFVVSNRSDRDLPIARRMIPQLPTTDLQVTDVDAFGSAALRSHEPQ